MLLFVQSAAASLEVPQLRIESPPELASARSRIESMDLRRLSDITRLVGIADPGPAIRVVLATESSDLAHSVPPWISGFAVGASDLVVIFPARSPNYPDDTLEDVLRHEIAHVLIWRAATGQPIPRWFDEGLAMSAERERRFQDQTQLLYQLVTSSRTNLVELNHLFAGNQTDQIRAYALAGALVHDVSDRYGHSAFAEILKRVSRGAPFNPAFEAATGITPEAMETEFWQRQRIWTTWVPIITSSTTLWLTVTLLALLAIHLRRRKNREIERRWAEEEEEDRYRP